MYVRSEIKDRIYYAIFRIRARVSTLAPRPYVNARRAESSIYHNVYYIFFYASEGNWNDKRTRDVVRRGIEGSSV